MEKKEKERPGSFVALNDCSGPSVWYIKPVSSQKMREGIEIYLVCRHGNHPPFPHLRHCHRHRPV